MEKPIFTTVNGLMEFRQRQKQVRHLLMRAREAIIFSLSPDDGFFEGRSRETYLMSLVKEMDAIMGELKNNDSD